jgi:hypothetical protein
MLFEVFGWISVASVGFEIYNGLTGSAFYYPSIWIVLTAVLLVYGLFLMKGWLQRLVLLLCLLEITVKAMLVCIWDVHRFSPLDYTFAALWLFSAFLYFRRVRLMERLG